MRNLRNIIWETVRMLRPLAASLLVLLSLTAPAFAEYRPIEDQREFLQLVQGRTLVLTRPGIARPIEIQVQRNGALTGEARGYDLTGAWRWENGKFCRQMDWGGYNVRYSCQDVSLNGRTLRFISDRGLFRTAYFEMR